MKGSTLSAIGVWSSLFATVIWLAIYFASHEKNSLWVAFWAFMSAMDAFFTWTARMELESLGRE